MRTTREILEYIDSYLSNATDRPKMYAANPESLEDTLSELDRLGSFIMSESGTRWIGESDEGYSAFCSANDLGSSNFCYRLKIDHQQEASFTQVAEFWKEYLTSKFFVAWDEPAS